MNGFQWPSTTSKFTKYSKQSTQSTTRNIWMANLLREVLDSLSRTNRAWDMFHRSDIQYFLHTEDSLDNTSTTVMQLHNIQSLLLEMKGFEQDLQDLKRELSESVCYFSSLSGNHLESSSWQAHWLTKTVQTSSIC